MKKKLAYLITHPIPYQSALMRALSKSKNFDLKVFYCSKISISNYKDKEMNKTINWNSNLLDGYDYKFLRSFFDYKVPSKFLPLNFGLLFLLKKEKFDFILIHGHARIYNIIVIILSKIFGLKVMLRSESNDMHSKRKYLSKIVLNFLDLFIDYYLAIGSLNKKYYQKRNIKNNKIKTMYYTVDNEYFIKYKLNLNKKKLFLQKYNIGSKIIFLFAAKLIDRKNIIFFLEAYIDLLKNHIYFKEKAHLIIIGDGILKKIVLNKIRNYKSYITLLGFIDQKKLPFYYYLSDIFVIPSKIENWGLTVNEAMCCGLPIISSDKVGSSYDLLDKNNSFIFKYNNIKDLHNSLIKSINADLKKMSKFSTEKIKYFDNNANLKIIEEILT